MAKVIKTLRNHWKKSAFGCGILAYGVNYGRGELEMYDKMRAVCERAADLGDTPAKIEKPKRITVILNPAANKRKAKKNFENFCAPLLHLAGVYVSIVETEREGHGRDIVTKLDPETDAIIVAGGDGTLSEVLTGLMRHQGELCQIPIGVLPLGRTNTLAKRLFGVESCSNYNGMASAAMTVVNGNTKNVDAMRIELIQESEDAKPKAPVYGFAGIEWGLWREIKKREDAFWYLGPLRKYVPLIFHGNVLEQEVSANIRYSKPCSGCSKCYQQRPDLMSQSRQNKGPSRWWNFMSLQNRRLQNQGQPLIDYNKVYNDECSVVEELAVKASDLSVITSNDPKIKLDDSRPHVLLTIAPRVRYQGELFFNGVKVLNEGKPVASKIEAKQIEIRPKAIKFLQCYVYNSEMAQEMALSPAQFHLASAGSLGSKRPFPLLDNALKLTTAMLFPSLNDEENLSIDNEEYEVRPIRVTVLPNAVKVFCP